VNARGARPDAAAPDREIVSARTFAAPRERVFEAFRDPARLARWWGPRGFRNTFEVFDLRPAAIIRDLDLLRPIYAETAAYGHFGRELPNFTWERTDRVDALKAAAGI